MAAEDFFVRWSKKKSDAAPDANIATSTDGKAVTNTSDVENPALPTQADVDKLTHDSDYSAFMAKGVDESVKQSAMKKLFTDPHFNIMDGLDIYIDDYSNLAQIPPEMLASISHAKSLLDPLSQLKRPLMRIAENLPATVDIVDADVEIAAMDEFTSASSRTATLKLDSEKTSQIADVQQHSSAELCNATHSKVQPDVDDV